MNKKIISTILILAFLTGNSAFCTTAKTTDTDNAFAPSKPAQEKIEPQNTEQTAAEKKEKKAAFKFWTNKKAVNKKAEQKEKSKKKQFNKKEKKKAAATTQNKEKNFVDAKNYAEQAYKNKIKEAKQSKKATKKNQKKSKKKAKTKEKNTQPQEIKLNNNAAANSKNFENEIDAQITNGKKTVQGSVSTNRIISVDDCVKIALENNPTIISLMMTRDIYKNQIAQAWSNYFPTINAGVTYSKNDMLVTNFKFPMQKYKSWNAPNLGVNMLLFDFGKTSTAAKIAKKTYEASEENLQANVNDIIYQVKSAYYNLLFAMQQVEVYEDTVANYEIHLKQAEAYYKIGTKAKIDVTTAAYNLDNAKLNLIQARNQVEMAYAQLNNAMGVPEYTDYEIKERLKSKKYDVIFDDIINIAYKQRPQLLAAKKKMEGSKLLIRASKYAFLPDVTGFGSYTRGGKNPSSDYGYQIGAQIAYSNLNLLLVKQQIDEAKLTYEKDKADFETQRQSVYLEVKQAYIQFKNAQETIPVAKSSMNQAKEQYDLASGRYKVGMGDAVELKDAENTYRNSQLNYYNSLTQYNISAANLEKVVGAPILPRETAL